MISPALPLVESRTPTTAWSDEELVLECLNGNEEAWNALVDKYRNLVYSVPVKYRLPAEDAADIFQAVWLELFSELPKLRSSKALRSWLITVAGHKCFQWKRRLRVFSSDGGDATDVADTPQTFLDWREQVEREQILRDALANLPERCQTMIGLLFFEQPALPYREVAARLGLAEGSIGFIRGRCLKKLRSSLETMGF